MVYSWLLKLRCSMATKQWKLNWLSFKGCMYILAIGSVCHTSIASIDADTELTLQSSMGFSAREPETNDSPKPNHYLADNSDTHSNIRDLNDLNHDHPIGCIENYSQDKVGFNGEENNDYLTSINERLDQDKCDMNDEFSTHNNENFSQDTGGLNKPNNAEPAPIESITPHNSSKSSNNINESLSRVPIVELHHTIQTVGSPPDMRDVPTNVIYVRDPARTLSVYEPHQDGTCQRGRLRAATVLQTAQNRRCTLAVNAGFFNTDTGECYGNIVSDGRLVQNTTAEVNDVHFGIRRNGSIFVGYITDTSTIEDEFLQLVGGVIWVLKDGMVNVDESIRSDFNATQTTGTLEEFALFVAARTLVGHDADGKVMILQVDGINEKQGVTLYDAARILKKYGAVNAINLDGGGSTTLVVNHTLVSFPADICKKDKNFHCVREVTTVLCVHEPLCDPPDCGGHGSCELGKCRCHGYWSGNSCDIFKTPNNSSIHGCHDVHEKSQNLNHGEKGIGNEYRSYTSTEAILGTTVIISITLNIVLLWKYILNKT